jgi:mono/diheme cytochrome c family protein
VLYVNASEMAWTGGLVPAAHGGSTGAVVYQNQCAMCHGPNRAGAPPDFPSLVGILNRLSIEKVTDNVKKGNGRMPSFPNIDDAHLNALIEYLRTDAGAGAGKESGPLPVQGMVAQAPEDKAGAAVYQDHLPRRSSRRKCPRVSDVDWSEQPFEPLADCRLDSKRKESDASNARCAGTRTGRTVAVFGSG